MAGKATDGGLQPLDLLGPEEDEGGTVVGVSGLPHAAPIDMGSKYVVAVGGQDVTGGLNHVGAGGPGDADVAHDPDRWWADPGAMQDPEVFELVAPDGPTE